MVICPRIRCPGVNVPLSRAPNHSPNCAGSVNARQTLDLGARRMTLFSIRSVLERLGDTLLPVMSNLLVACQSRSDLKKRNRSVAPCPRTALARMLAAREEGAFV
jgi:hypothetical protein